MATKLGTLLKGTTAALVIPVLIGVIIMLPRLASPQFGLFDDVNTLSTVERVSNGDWTVDDEAGSGRFRPTYWYYYTLIYLLAGAKPFWFMLGNLVLLSGITVGVVLIVRMYGLSNLQAGIAGSLFVLAGPIIENAYTLSKGELQQTFWLILAVLLSLSIRNQKNTHKRNLLLGGAISVAMLIGHTTKETTMGVVSISTGWVLIAWFRKRRQLEDIPDGMRIRMTFFLAMLVSLAAYFAFRWSFMPLGFSSGGYSNNYVVSLDRFLAAGRVWIDWLNRDFLFLLPLAFVAVLMLAIKKRFYENIILVDAGIWMIGWITIFLPWIHQLEYYLLPFSVGAAIFSGTIIGYVVSQRKSFSRGEYVLSGLLLSLSIVLFSLTLPNNLTQAKLQLIIDRTNDEIIDYLRDDLPENSVLYVNISKDNQYFSDLKKFLIGLGGRRDLVVEAYVNNDRSTNGLKVRSVFVLVPHLTNQYYPSIRMGIYQNPSTEWNRLLYESLGNQLEPIYATNGIIKLILVDSARLFCPALPGISYCHVENAPFDTRTLSYGWDLYLITPVP